MTDTTTRLKARIPTDRSRASQDGAAELSASVSARRESAAKQFLRAANDSVPSQEREIKDIGHNGTDAVALIDGTLHGPRMGATNGTTEPTIHRTVRVQFDDMHTVEIPANPIAGHEHLVCEARRRVIDAGLAHGRFRRGEVVE